MVKATAVQNTDSASSARMESMDGVSSHGRSIARLAGMRNAVPHSKEPAAGAGAGRARIGLLEAPPEDRRARIAHGGGDDGELRNQGVAEPAERFQSNDQ